MKKCIRYKEQNLDIIGINDNITSIKNSLNMPNDCLLMNFEDYF